MSIFNASEISTFFLTGIPQMKYAHIWVFISICFIYPIVILGNCTILFFLKTKTSLNEYFLYYYLYYFFCMLALSDLGLSISSLPTMLRIFLFDATGISPDACFAQEFFIHGFSAMVSLVLIMSVSRFIAIRNPLRYTSILTTVRVIKIGLCLLFVVPFPFILKRLRFCKKSLLSHSYCLHQNVMKVAYSDHRVDIIYGLFVALTVILDSNIAMCISVSYMLILKIVLCIASHKAHLKFLNPCISHICSVLIFCVPIVTLSIIYQFTKNVFSVIRIIIADIFLLVPLLMQPTMYTVKNQQIRNFIFVKLCEKQS
ncbi:LOW QUALITY PROTEIN: olfactory receptor 51A4-like [Rousettus aegyptiacus]|uniref:LOW QUALITY PROTEIN: olfactory receptor 51A4-like n=1 Tax=Rousettus aegyptiacus TaxID=9407 RepID=UPI00168CCF2F|nr:LOW QUALITY PROTEIN: olfactory receptor 51A4-like [Rousettus aegyptiacus]